VSFEQPPLRAIETKLPVITKEVDNPGMIIAN